jgi:hypothetical protein
MTARERLRETWPAQRAPRLRAVAGLVLLAGSASACAVLGSGAPAAAPPPLSAQSPAQSALPTIAVRTEGLTAEPGLLPLYHETTTGRLLLEAPDTGGRFLYYLTPATGSGSGWLGIERGAVLWWEGGALVRFERHGPKLLLMRENVGFNASGPDGALAAAVRESFAESVLGALPLVAADEGRVLVDATDFFLRDATDVVRALRDYDSGSFRLDRERSAIHVPGTRAFPGNTEVEALLTFASDAPGRDIARHAPDGRAVTLRVRHSFVALPAPGFQPRPADPRLGLFTLTRYDFDRAFDQGYRRQIVQRWRLEKADPGAVLSEPVRPITLYLDPAIPAAYRGAIRDGALYWNDALESAGFRDAVRVKDLPSGADPLDVRYSVIQWMPRSQVTASMATWVSDPRTGEILKANILIDPHRSLVDYNTYMGLRPALAPCEPDAETFVMARRRWLAAHEVAHAVGALLHSGWSPSAVGFFVPGVAPTADGRLTLDVAQAFLAEPSDYDRWHVRYLYSEMSPEDEERQLAAIIQDGLDRGLRYVSDYHGGAGSIPRATGRRQSDDLLADLEQYMAVRRIALERFDQTALEPGEPLARLFGRLVPVYFHHRYMLLAVAKAVGGFEFAYASRGDGQSPGRVLPPSEQRRALELLLAALEPGALVIPERVARLIPPPAYTETPSELEPIVSGAPDVFTYLPGEAPWIRIQLSAGSAFDPLAWARALAGEVVDQLLHPTRAARLVALHARDGANPSLDEVIRRTVDATWGGPVPRDAGEATMRRVTGRVVLDRLLALEADTAATPEVRAAAGLHLERLSQVLARSRSSDDAERAHVRAATRDLQRWRRSVGDG